ncbi:zinc-binding alcohol dehydrogenase [Humibacter sp.]|uniref:zinc-dependent alcohol dehydrogenase n=1 Tax=Humibacter sp. TaxID=1940291 RepID=UPI002C3CA118|nr:zinc-binding alcohol dehydrogenase [Humibacter sp.]HVX08576.1 zinc-binding alcohol dehydrogenase [Humibacter sp.]
MLEATAFWIDGPGVGALRTQPLDAPGDGEVLVRTRHTGVSRGTESSVFLGRVPRSEHQRMRAPFQEGDFPAPVKYGYLNVGVVERGPDALVGRTVFTLFPHQSAFVVPADAVLPVPEGVPARRAVLAGAVETGVNVLWDAAPLIGDRVTVVGAGMIGCCVARLLSDIPQGEVTLVDIDPAKRQIAERLGVRFAEPDAAPRDRDIVIDASGSASGLQLALQTVATEGEVIEASWFGDAPVPVTLGADFHSRRLTIRSSQVGMVPQRRRGTRTTKDRLALALRLLRDPAFDALLSARSSWRELPAVMAALARGAATADGVPVLCHTIDWEDEA